MNIVKELRKKAGIQQKELAIIIGVSRPIISEWESGRKDPSGERLKKLAQFFGVDELVVLGTGVINLGQVSPATINNDALADYDNAAVKAMEILIRYHVSTAPISPLTILQAMPGVFTVTFTEMADRAGLDHKSIVTSFGAENQDAVSFLADSSRNSNYIVAYNQSLPYYMIQRSLAREMGHIVLAHDSSIPESVRIDEALTFARHLLCPRPLIKALQDAGIRITVKMIGNLTGCYGRFIAGMRNTPGVNVLGNLNSLIRSQLSGYISNILDFKSIVANDDGSPTADFGTYMDNYQE